MKYLVRAFGLFILMAALTGVSNAAVITFESFADHANINGINLGGVTVTSPSGNVEIFDNRFGVSFHSATKAIASFTPGTALSVNPMIFTFDAPQSFVGLWGGDGGGDIDNWTLNAYDAAVGGNLVGFALSGDFIGSPYAFLSITSPTILRVEAIWNGPTAGIGYDDLTFTPSQTGVPEPSSFVLVCLGFAICLVARQRISHVLR